MLKPTLMCSAAKACVCGRSNSVTTAASAATAARRICAAQCLAKLPAIKPSPFGPAAGARSLQIESTSAPTFDVLRPPGSVLIWSLHHFIARHDAPKIRGRRILLPDLGALRTVAMPRPRLEIAERFVHLVELGKGLSDQAVRRAMIGEQIVTDAVAARAPQQLVAVEA